MADKPSQPATNNGIIHIDGQWHMQCGNTTASIATSERKTTRTQGKTETPVGSQPCARCKILIFADVRQIPSYLTNPALHQAQGDYCPELSGIGNGRFVAKGTKKMAILKTKKEIENLKSKWESDPCWNIEETKGFEAHYDELLSYRLEKKQFDEIDSRATELKCSFELAEYIVGLERKLSAMNETIATLYLQ